MQSLRQYRRLKQQVDSNLSQRTPPTEPKPARASSDEESDLDLPVPGADVDPAPHHIIVDWDSPSDPSNPRNWALSRRLLALAIIWINVFALDFPSSEDSQASTQIASAFHVSAEAESLSPALYTLGVACGSLFAGPISESVGRNPIYVVSRIINVAFLAGCAFSPNAGAYWAFRFLAGVGGSTLLCIHGASTADLFNPVERGWAWPIIGEHDASKHYGLRHKLMQGQRSLRSQARPFRPWRALG